MITCITFFVQFFSILCIDFVASVVVGVPHLPCHDFASVSNCILFIGHGKLSTCIWLAADAAESKQNIGALGRGPIRRFPQPKQDKTGICFYCCYLPQLDHFLECNDGSNFGSAHSQPWIDWKFVGTFVSLVGINLIEMRNNNNTLLLPATKCNWIFLFAHMKVVSMSLRVKFPQSRRRKCVTEWRRHQNCITISFLLVSIWWPTCTCMSTQIRSYVILRIEFHFHISLWTASAKRKARQKQFQWSTDKNLSDLLIFLWVKTNLGKVWRAPLNHHKLALMHCT